MSLLVKIGADLSSFERQMKKATRDIQTVSKTLGDMGKSLTTKVTLPIVGIGAAAVKVGMDFETGMSKVAAITGATGEDFDRLKDTAKELGSSTMFSAKQSAEAMTYLGMAGYDTNQIISSMPGLLDLAAASGSDLGIVADIVSDSMTAFGMSAEETGKFADLLASASSNANTNVEMLGESFKYVAPVAGALGFSVEDTSKALALMANNGIKGSQAGTALRTMMTNLASPTKAMKDAMEELGISLTDTDGNMKTLDQIMDELRGSFGHLDEAQQAAYASTIFGKEAMSGALAIINASEEDYNKLTDATTNYSGSAKEMADTMQDNLQGQLTKLKSALEGVGIQISEILIPKITKVVDKIQVWVDWFANLDEGTQATIVKIGLAVAAIGPLLLAVSKTIAIFGKLKAAALILAPAVGAISLPVVAVVAGIGVLIAIGVALWKNWDTVTAKAGEFGSAVSSRVSSMRDNFVSSVTNLKDRTTSIFNSTRDAIVNPINTARDRVKTTVDNIVGFFSGLGSKLKFEIPRPKLPRFSLDGNFSLAPPSVPRLNISWHKRGGFFDQPTIAGLGEAGKEAIVPLVGSQMDPFADAVARRMKQNSGGFNNGRVEQLLLKLLNKNQVIVLDTGELVGRTYDKHDKYGGNKTTLAERWGR
ncbi:MAG: phage tail tape measure protein [Bacillaceae bacterium]|nr:phage tail tape measure protein [Bacillaceae bacterium]